MLQCNIHLRRKVKRKGKYLFTIDWCAGDFNELNFGYAEKPDQHKCGHVLATRRRKLCNTAQ